MMGRVLVIQGLHLAFSHIKGDEENSHHDQSQGQWRTSEKIMNPCEGLRFCHPSTNLGFLIENHLHSLKEILRFPGSLLQIKVHEELIDKNYHSREDAGCATQQKRPVYICDKSDSQGDD